MWQFETRIWFCILMMFSVGSLEWWYLIRLTTTREPKTKLSGDNVRLTTPIDVSQDPLIAEERERSRVDNEGINGRDLVKVFEVKDAKKRERVVKRVVKGVSFGIRKNEIFALLGPNGKIQNKRRE